MSTRYVAPVAFLLVLALVPTVLHGYLGLRQDDGRRAASVTAPPSLVELAGAKSRTPDWAERRLATRDFTERTFATPEGEVRLSVARTYDAKKVYHHPELAVAYGLDLPRTSVERLASMPGVPVHVLRAAEGGPRKMVCYALHYGDGFVDNPLWFQFRLAGEMLVGGRKPMTLFFVTADDPGGASLEGTWAARVLEAAVQQFQRQPGAGAAAAAD
jgi:hypothetical protein